MLRTHTNIGKQRSVILNSVKYISFFWRYAHQGFANHILSEGLELVDAAIEQLIEIVAQAVDRFPKQML